MSRFVGDVAILHEPHVVLTIARHYERIFRQAQPSLSAHAYDDWAFADFEPRWPIPPEGEGRIC